MDKGLRLREFWNWLPVFRVVAEREHLPTASTKLHVSISAISRTIRLLEDRLGYPLFERSGRRLRLNGEGELLLGAVRAAMRVVDDGVEAAGSTTLTGAVHVSASEALMAAFILPAMMTLRKAHPNLVLHLYNSDAPREADARLVLGEFDVAFHDAPVVSELLEVARLGEVPSGIFCGRTHPLFRVKRIDLSQILSHVFVAPTHKKGEASPDGWPPQLVRRVGVYSTQLDAGLELCAGGGLLGVFPVPIAEPMVRAKRLRLLPLDLIARTPLFSVRRKALGPTPRVDCVLGFVREQVQRRQSVTRAITQGRKRR